LTQPTPFARAIDRTAVSVDEAHTAFVTTGSMMLGNRRKRCHRRVMEDRIPIRTALSVLVSAPRAA